MKNLNIYIDEGFFRNAGINPENDALEDEQKEIDSLLEKSLEYAHKNYIDDYLSCLYIINQKLNRLPYGALIIFDNRAVIHISRGGYSYWINLDKSDNYDNDVICQRLRNTKYWCTENSIIQTLLHHKSHHKNYNIKFLLNIKSKY